MDQISTLTKLGKDICVSFTKTVEGENPKG